MLNNALAKLLLFLTAGNVRMAFDSKIIRRVSGAITVIPASATFLILGVFAVTGWPPFGMFVSEFTILSAGFASGHVAACVIFIVCVVAVFFGFIYYGSGMVFGVPHGPAPGREAGMGTLILLGVLAAALLLLGLVMPEPLRRIIDQAVTVLRG